MLTTTKWTPALNRFALRLAAELPSENHVVSPASLLLALAPLLRASSARGVLDEQTLELPDATTNRLFAAPNGSSLRCAMASALFTDIHRAFGEDFLLALARFGLETRTLDFTSPDAAETVNRWIAVRTDGLIPSVTEAFPPQTTLALVQALHYADNFSEPFDPAISQRRVFHGASGDQETLFLRRAEALYAETAAMQAAMLPLTGGGGLCIFLSKDPANTAPVFPTDDAALRALDWQLCEGELALPRFTLDCAQDCLPLLERMGLLPPPQVQGVPQAIDSVRIQSALHRAQLRVDEHGVSAAAATVLCASGALPPDAPKPFTMVCDRPFSVLLFDRDAAYIPCVLFVGHVVNIEAELQEEP